MLKQQTQKTLLTIMNSIYKSGSPLLFFIDIFKKTVIIIIKFGNFSSPKYYTH